MNSLYLPPEVVLLIFTHLTRFYADASHGGFIRTRNGVIFRAALVSNTWASVGLSILYSHLHIEWRSSRAALLYRTPQLQPLHNSVRHLEAWCPTRRQLVDEWYESADMEVIRTTLVTEWNEHKR